MSTGLKEKPTTFDEAIEIAYNAPGHTFNIDTPYGLVEVRIIVSTQEKSIDQMKREKKKEDVFTKLIRGSSPAKLNKGRTDISQNYKNILYGKDGAVK